jgi:hypothetical protein
MKKHLVHEHIIELTKYKACMKKVENGDVDRNVRRGRPSHH